MRREKLLLILGILTIALPNLGFSNFVEKIIFAVFGFVLVLVAYGIYFERNRAPKKKVSRTRAVPTELKEPMRAKDLSPRAEEITGFTYVNPSSAHESGNSEDAVQ